MPYLLAADHNGNHNGRLLLIPLDRGCQALALGTALFIVMLHKDSNN